MMSSRLTGAFALLFCLPCAWPSVANAQGVVTYDVPVTVISSDGSPLTNLQSQNIRVRGRDVRVRSFNLDSKPRKIVLLLDTSGSMSENENGKTRLDVAFELMSFFLDDESAADLLAFYQFSDTPREVVPMSNNVAAIRRAMKPIPPSQEREMVGKTNIGDALNELLTNTHVSLAFGDSIVIFSDGEFDSTEGRQRPLGSFERALVQRGVRVFLALAREREKISNETQSVVSLTRASPDSRRLRVPGSTVLADSDPNASEVSDSESFVAAVGGESFAPADYSNIPRVTHVFWSNDLSQRMKSLLGMVQSTYRLELQFSRPLRSKKQLRLEVVNERGKALHNVTVLSPAFVYPNAGGAPITATTRCCR